MVDVGAVVRWVIVTIILLVPQVDADNPLNSASSAYLRGDYQEARRLWLRAARKGHTSAQMSLGFLYERGKGVRRDDAEAMAWYLEAAKAGLAAAQYRVGLMYEVGKGTQPDVWEAEAWYKRATDQGLCPGEIAEPEDFLLQ